MDQRLKLHEKLKSITENVYFQPPNGLYMNYPCIVYKRSGLYKKYANNGSYIIKWRYTLTVIDKDPDSEIVDKLAELPGCEFDRHFESDNINHDVFNIYV